MAYRKFTDGLIMMIQDFSLKMLVGIDLVLITMLVISYIPEFIYSDIKKKKDLPAFMRIAYALR